MSNVTFTPQTNLSDEFAEMLTRLRTPRRDALAPVADAIRNAIAENFDREASEEGEWEELAPATVKDRQRRGYGGEHPILVRTGELLDSLTNAGHADHVERIAVDDGSIAVDVGSSNERVGWHEQGTSTIPARSFLALDEQQIDRVGDAIDRYFSLLFDL